MLLRFSLTVFIFILLSSCHFENKEIDPRLLSLLEADAILISDEESLELESNYYDALLEVKKMYPLNIQEVVVISRHEVKGFKDVLQVHSYPSLLLVRDKEIITKIEGKQDTNSIINHVSQIFRNK